MEDSATRQFGETVYLKIELKFSGFKAKGRGGDDVYVLFRPYYYGRRVVLHFL